MKGDCGKHFYKWFNCLYNIVGQGLLSFSMKYIKTMSRGAKKKISREWHYVIAIIVDHWITVCGWVNFILITRDDETVIVDIFLVAVRDGQKPCPQMATSEILWVSVTIKGIDQQTDITLISIIISGTNDWDSLQ